MSDKNALCGRKAEAATVIDLAGGSGDALLIETLQLLAELDQDRRNLAIREKGEGRKKRRKKRRAFKNEESGEER